MAAYRSLHIDMRQVARVSYWSDETHHLDAAYSILAAIDKDHSRRRHLP